MAAPYFLFPFVAILLWAGNVMVTKLAVNAIDPTVITFWRLVFAVALMSTFVQKPVWRNRAVIVPQLPRLAFLGFLGMALFQCLAYQAAETTTATSMAIITSFVPLLTMLLSVLLLREAADGGHPMRRRPIIGWSRLPDQFRKPSDATRRWRPRR
jgi:drug/metabolite transporter (DMT)-like permease